MDLKGIQHTLPCHDNLLRLLLHGERTDKSCNLLSSFPFSQLSETLLSGPYRGMDNLEEELTSSGVEDENCAVDRLGGEITLEGFVNSDPVHVGVVYEPNDLVAEQLPIVLGGEVGFSWLRGVQLQTLPYPFSQHIQSRVCLHDLGHSLLNQRFSSGEPVSEG